MGQKHALGAGAVLIGGSPERAPAAAQAEKSVELLPFTVRIARTEDDLQKAITIRHAAYGRHVPLLAEKLAQPESYDREKGTAVLLAESKFDGAPLGSIRIQTRRYKKLALEQSIELPKCLQSKRVAEATRLGVSDVKLGRLVKYVLFKAFYVYCSQGEIEWMVITARSPLDRQYEALLFEDVYPGAGYIPMRHVGNIPHRVLALSVSSVDRKS